MNHYKVILRACQDAKAAAEAFDAFRRVLLPYGLAHPDVYPLLAALHGENADHQSNEAVVRCLHAAVGGLTGGRESLDDRGLTQTAYGGLLARIESRCVAREIPMPTPPTTLAEGAEYLPAMRAWLRHQGLQDPFVPEGGEPTRTPKGLLREPEAVAAVYRNLSVSSSECLLRLDPAANRPGGIRGRSRLDVPTSLCGINKFAQDYWRDWWTAIPSQTRFRALLCLPAPREDVLIS